MLVIDPNECIDCNLCVPECPVDAIFAEDDLPAGQKHFLDINAKLAANWPMITAQKSAPADADEWKDVPNKLQYLKEEWEK
jgi:ferredoxin